MRRLALLLVAFLPAATALAAVRPVEAAAPEGFSSFGLTVTAAALRTEGVVGASGGLVTLDAGAAYTTGRLDGGPSSYALGAPVEPGTLVRTLVGTANTQAGQTVFTVPDAESAYPGRGSASTSYADPAAAGPLTLTPGTATSSASPTQADATTTGAAAAVTGAADASRLSSVTELSGDGSKGQGEASGTSRVGTLTVAGGLLVLHDVVGTARVVVTGGLPVATSTLTIGSATVAGQPVTIDQDGVHAAGQGTGLGQLQDAQHQVDDALAASGVSVRAVGAVKSVEGRSGYADTGGLRITVATPDLPAGVAANALTLTVGKVTVTGTSAAASPPVVDVPLPPVDGTPAVPTTTTVTVVGGTSGSPTTATGTIPPPTLAAGRGSVSVAGRTVPAAAALAAFGVWQLLTLSTTTLYAFVDRRRRLEEES